MSDTTKLRIEVGQVHQASCACCGNETRTLSGYVYSEDVARAVYYVTGTVGQPDHGLTVDLIIGSWGEAACGDRRGVSLVFRNGAECGFMVTDAAARLRATTLVDIPMARQDVISGGWAAEVFQIVDAIWLQDERIHGL